MAGPTLTLIQNEIERLKKKSDAATSGLSIEDVRKLEMLVKMKQSLHEKGDSDAHVTSPSDVTDAQILASLGNAEQPAPPKKQKPKQVKRGKKA